LVEVAPVWQKGSLLCKYFRRVLAALEEEQLEAQQEGKIRTLVEIVYLVTFTVIILSKMDYARR